MNKPHVAVTYQGVLAFLACSCLLGCGGQVRPTDLDTYDRFRTQRIEPRDSLFVLYTVKELGKLNWYTFANYSAMYQMKNEQVEYFIGGTFYSPNRTKIIVWIGERLPNARTIDKYSEDPEVNRICPHGSDTIYLMSAVIGFRNDPDSTWQLYPFNNEQAVCWITKEQVLNILGQYYFEKMKGHAMYHISPSGPRKGEEQLEAYGFNLQDEGFWTKCWLWQRDSVSGCGLFPFQLARGYCHPFEVPHIVYPDEILSMFEQHPAYESR